MHDLQICGFDAPNSLDSEKSHIKADFLLASASGFA
jgi:hypothetical protein